MERGLPVRKRLCVKENLVAADIQMTTEDAAELTSALSSIEIAGKRS